MRAISIIALNTYKELIRDRILYGLLLFAVLFLGLSVALSNLSIDEGTRMIVNFGLLGIHLSSVILAIFVGSTLVFREIEKQTILTLLARPISRGQFLVGKYIGMGLLLLTVNVGLALIFVAIISQAGTVQSLSLAIALLGILEEALVLLSVTILFSVFTRPMLAICFSVGVFLIGHWLGEMAYFASKSSSVVFQTVTKITSWVLPNLERYNWRALASYGDIPDANLVWSATGQLVGWILILFVFTDLIFRRKDFV